MSFKEGDWFRVPKGCRVVMKNGDCDIYHPNFMAASNKGFGFAEFFARAKEESENSDSPESKVYAYEDRIGDLKDRLDAEDWDTALAVCQHLINMAGKL